MIVYHDLSLTGSIAMQHACLCDQRAPFRDVYYKSQHISSASSVYEKSIMQVQQRIGKIVKKHVLSSKTCFAA